MLKLARAGGGGQSRRELASQQPAPARCHGVISAILVKPSLVPVTPPWVVDTDDANGIYRYSAVLPDTSACVTHCVPSHVWTVNAVGIPSQIEANRHRSAPPQTAM
jgi:hypothetical protein